MLCETQYLFIPVTRQSNYVLYYSATPGQPSTNCKMSRYPLWNAGKSPTEYSHRAWYPSLNVICSRSIKFMERNSEKCFSIARKRHRPSPWDVIYFQLVLSYQLSKVRCRKGKMKKKSYNVAVEKDRLLLLFLLHLFLSYFFFFSSSYCEKKTTCLCEIYNMNSVNSIWVNLLLLPHVPLH